VRGCCGAAIKGAALWGKGQLAKKQQCKEPKGQEERTKQGKIQKEYQSIVFELHPLTRAAVHMANTDLHVRPNLDRYHSRTRTRDIAVLCALARGRAR
jgi:hypothetical protein